MREEEFRAMGEAARDSLGEYREALAKLAQQRVDHESEEGTLRASVDLTGRLLEMHLRPDAMRNVDRYTLAEQIVETIRAAQAKAKREYEEEQERITPESLRTYQTWLKQNLRG